jgi:hypothetical protein
MCYNIIVEQAKKMNTQERIDDDILCLCCEIYTPILLHSYIQPKMEQDTQDVFGWEHTTRE